MRSSLCLSFRPVSESGREEAALCRRADMRVGALQDFVKAMGGELKITARFPEGTVEINQFAALGKTEEGD